MLETGAPATLTATAPSLGFWSCLIHVQGTPTHIAAVDTGNCLLGFLIVVYLDKSEPARLAGVTSTHYVDALHLPITPGTACAVRLR
jgi:hypothetical protein